MRARAQGREIHLLASLEHATGLVLGRPAPFAEGFGGRLEMLGYTPQSRVVHLRLTAHLSGWLEERELDGSASSASVTDGSIHDRPAAVSAMVGRAGRCGRCWSTCASSGRAPQFVSRQVVGPVEEALADYAAFRPGPTTDTRAWDRTQAQHHTEWRPICKPVASATGS